MVDMNRRGLIISAMGLMYAPVVPRAAQACAIVPKRGNGERFEDRGEIGFQHNCRMNR
jgi:hypothetical protein